MLDPLTLAGLGFTAVTAASLLTLHLRRVVVPVEAQWPDPPPVIYHIGLGPRAAKDIAKAMSFWDDLGYKFEGLFPGTVAPVYGIFVDVPTAAEVMEDGMAGRAYLSLGVGTDLESVRVVVSPDLSRSERAAVLRHELGHALGLGHAYAGLDRKGRVRGHPSGHVMHPKQEKLGSGTRGIPRG